MSNIILLHADVLQRLLKAGIPTEYCRRCGAQEVSALRYACGSRWRKIDEDRVDLLCTQDCARRESTRKACAVLVLSALVQKKTSEIHELREFVDPAGTEQGTWQVSVVKITEEGDEPEEES